MKTINKTRATSLAWSATLSFAFLLHSATAAEPESLARVGEVDIKIEEVRPFLENLDAREQAALARDPSLLNQFVRSIIAQQLLLKEAVAAKWDQQPASEVRLERIRQGAIAEGYLQSVSKVPEGYPSEAELKAAYEANKAAFLVPKQFRLAQIFIAAPPSADKTAVAKAQAKVDAVRASLKSPDADFGAVARTNSEEQQSAARNGEIGWLGESQIQPEVRAQVLALSKNGISDAIRLNDGWHILKVLDTKDAYTASLEEIKDPLVQQLRAARTKANSEAYLAALLQKNPVAINEIALSKIVTKGAQ